MKVIFVFEINEKQGKILKQPIIVKKEYDYDAIKEFGEDYIAEKLYEEIQEDYDLLDSDKVTLRK